jgi:hypothetical protein
MPIDPSGQTIKMRFAVLYYMHENASEDISKLAAIWK